MAYCVNCGTEIVSNAKFCQKCGHPTGIQNDTSTRKQEFAGKIYKCPNCGEVLKAFEINCPACGHELRGTKASSAVKEFALKLEAIESRREYEKPRDLFAAAEAQQRVSKTDEQKISLIKNFSVPNSKEDMLEFMILATSNMNMNAYDSANTATTKAEKEISAAWFSKVQQVYEKAKRSYSTDDVFAEIKELYDQCNSNIQKAKKKRILKWILLWGGMAIFFVVVLGILGVILGVAVPKAEKAEIERLEGIVAEVQQALDNKEYKHALRIADSIDYQRNKIDMERKWDIQREYWIEKVIAAAAEEGVTMDYPIDTADEKDKKNDDSSTQNNYQQNIDEFNQQMEDVKEQWNEIWNSGSSETNETDSSVGFVEGTFESVSVKGFSFDIPNYWSEEGSKNEYLQYYAEKGDKVVMLSIAYPEESDDDYDVSFDGLYTDNENMIKAVGAMFTDGDVYDHEVFESENGVKGILYRFTYNQKIDWLTKVDGSGYCFCFPSEDDRRWFYVVLLYTNNVASDDYRDDYMTLISTIRKKSQ